MDKNIKTQQNLMFIRAKQLFQKRKYKKTLNQLSLILFNKYTKTTNKNTKNYQDEALALSLLCDIATQNEPQAQSLFNKAQSLELLGKKNIWKIILNDIKAIDDMNEYLNEIVQKIDLKQIKKDNSISYSDFMQSVSNKKSFKTAFIDSMFSTKILIKNKDELGVFAYNLIKNDFENMASHFIGNNTLYEHNNTQIMLFDDNKKNK